MTGQSTDKNYVLTKTYTDATTGTITQDDIITTVQYYDGLGRPIQTINFEAGGAHQDIVTPVVYDDGGKVTKNYLPYANPNSSTGSLNYRDNSSLISTQQSRYYAKYPDDFTSLANTNAYSETFYDNSPLNRVLKQGAPGTTWKGNTNDDNDHTIKKVYTANQSNEVRRFAVSFSGSNTELTNLEIVGYYNPQELYKTITKDENWISGVNNTVEEFKDKEGRVVLTRKYNNNKTHDTYYVYDKFSNLTYVIPPLAADDIASQGTIKTEVVDGLCYIYHYDYRNRVIEKKIPGKGWEYMVYDRLDRIIMSQDDKMRSADGGYLWLFTKYDIYGRVAYTGTLKRTSSRSIIQNEFNAISHPNMNEVRTTSAFSGKGVSVYYTNQAYPDTTTGTNYTVNTINYYDSYSNIGVSAPPSTVYDEVVTTVVKLLPVVTWVRVMDESNPNKYIRTTSGYDKKARLIYSYVNDTYSQYTQTTLLDLDFTGKVLKQKTTHVKQISGQPQSKVVVDYFNYDHMGRMLKHTQNGNEGDFNRELIASNTYDELGVMIKKGVGGSQLASLPLQTVDYTFNVRGWLKLINNPDAKLTDDLFAFKINYNDPTLGSTPLYNGNISETFWKSKSDGKLRSYSYKYDHLNRLTDAKYTQQYYLISNPSQLENYTEGSIIYDKNGNIITLTRYGLYDDHNVDMIGKIDVLNYTYKPFSNTLIAVEDQGPSEGFNNGDSSSEEYLYDVNGNMTIDTNKKIIKTNYNYLNQPTEVAFSNNAIIYYIYTATGTKLKKIVRQPDGTAVETEYSGGFIYEKQHSGTNTFQYFATTEGYAVKSTDPKKSFDYIYQYKDHLGNVRLSYKDVDGNGAISNAEIVEQSNYYAFGLQHKGYNGTVTPYGNAVAQKWKYNGTELEEFEGYNMYEMDARQYDPALARWVVIDPVTHHGMSPYNAFDNNPVFWADPSGADAYNTVMSLFNRSGSGYTTYTRDSWFAGGNIFTESAFEDPYNNGAGSAQNASQAGGGGPSFFGRIWNSLFGNKNKSYVSADNLILTGLGDTVETVDISELEGRDGATYNNRAFAWALPVSSGLVADDATIVGFVDDVLIPVVLAAASAQWVIDNKVLLAKQAVEIGRLLEKTLKTKGFTYELRVNNSGLYTNVRGNEVYLKAGDVWKYGETTGMNRYPQSYLNKAVNGGLTMVPIFYGNQAEIKIQEKIMIYGYFFEHGSLPPGNKIFR